MQSKSMLQIVCAKLCFVLLVYLKKLLLFVMVYHKNI